MGTDGPQLRPRDWIAVHKDEPQGATFFHKDHDAFNKPIRVVNLAGDVIENGVVVGYDIGFDMRVQRTTKN